MAALSSNKNRLLFVYFCIFVGFAAVALRLIFLVAFSDKPDLGNIYSPTNIKKRANIVDRNGTIIATDIDVKILYANSDLIRDPESVSRKISNAFPELHYFKLLKRLSDKSRDGWILIKRNVTPKQERTINRLGIAGLIFEDSKTRFYPQKSSFSHLVGYTDLDGNGLSGIENQYDDFLKNSNVDLQLSVDVRLQGALNNELKNAILKYKASSAFGIILDVRNGEILALSSLPNFDLNNQSNANKKEKFNRATHGVYELGSVFKIFNHAHAIEKNLIRLKDTYSVKDPIKYGRFTIDDDHKDKYVLDATEVFTQSSNIGSVRIAQSFTPEEQKAFSKKIGLLSQLNINFPSLGTPIIPKRWGEISRATISFGHGIAVTPLHLARSVGAIVNDGKLIKPTFIKNQGEQIEFVKVISDNTSNIMRDLMYKTMEEGTGKNAKVEGLKIGGKTGTAERAEGGGYNKRKTLASFVAALPIDDPKYVIFIGIDKPNYMFNTGGMVAAPVTGEVIKNIAPILGNLY